MEQVEVKNETVVIYLKNSDWSDMHSVGHIDHAMIRKWVRENTPVEKYDMVIRPIYSSGKVYKEAMDEVLDIVKDHKYFVLIIAVGCHATQYIYDRLLEKVESPSCISLHTVSDYINITPAVLVPKEPITITLDSIRRCITQNQLQSAMEGSAHVRTMPTGINQLSYASSIIVKIERRPETLEEKFNTVMGGALSNLTPYWDITPHYIDVKETEPTPIDESLMAASDSEE